MNLAIQLDASRETDLLRIMGLRFFSVRVHNSHTMGVVSMVFLCRQSSVSDWDRSWEKTDLAGGRGQAPDGHDDEGGEDLLGEDADVETHVEHDQLHQALCVEQEANRQRFPVCKKKSQTL